MEKRRLLLVVMLLATSGAAWAGDSDNESGTKKGRGARIRSRVSKKAKGGLHAIVRVATWPARVLTRTRPVNQFEVSLQSTCEDVEDGVTVSKKAIDCLLEQYGKLERKLLYGTTVGLAVALIYTARNKKVQDGVKGLLRRVRSFGFRKKTPEKKTDATTIEA
jgi:hypothetical protein